MFVGAPWRYLQFSGSVPFTQLARVRRLSTFSGQFAAQHRGACLPKLLPLRENAQSPAGLSAH